MSLHHKNKVGIIGSPISHSLSPLIHNYWMKKHNIEGNYSCFDVKKKDVKSFVKKAKLEKYLGFNVTIPHKQNIINSLDEISTEAKALGAVNTVAIKNGRAFGYNTDTQGFIENLNFYYPTWSSQKGVACVIGAGGAARAAVWALLKKKFYKIQILNRTKERALALIADMKNHFPLASFSFSNLTEAITDGAVLCINTTSLGMKGQPPLKMNLSHLHKEAIVYDLIYLPTETELILQAKRYNFSTLGGVGMLLFQAAPAFQMWFGKRAVVDTDLKGKILKAFE